MFTDRLSSFGAAAVAASSVLVAAGQASAALTTVQASAPITVQGQSYNVFFNKETQSATTFNDVFGTGTPALTFTTLTDATAARDAIVAGIPAAEWDPFGLPTSGFTGIFVPFVASATGFNRVGANYLIPNGPAFPLAAPNNNDAFGRTQSFNFSFVTFQPVPAPGVGMTAGAFGVLVAGRRSRRVA
jgi:hypothetical protein